MRKRLTYDNSLIIAPPSKQSEFLEYKKEYPETRFTLIDKENFVKWNCFKYDERAEISLLSKGYRLSAVKEILRAFEYYDEAKDYKDAKLRELKPLFLELKNKGLLYKDFMPSGLFDGKHILISGYRSTKRIGKALEDIKNLDTSFDLFPEPQPYKEVHIYSTLIGECHDLCFRIAKLLRENEDISPDDIYIANYSSSYHFVLSLFAKAYGFSIAFPSSTPLSEVEIGRRFLSLYEEKGDLDSVREEMEKTFSFSPDYNKIFLLAKTYLIPELSSKEQLALYQDLLSSTNRSKAKTSPAVKILNGRYAKEGSHVFYLDFSLETTPKTPQNPSYFSENALIELGIPSLIEQRNEDKTELLGLLKQKEIEWIGFHKRHYGEESHPSPIIADEHLKTVEAEEPSTEYSPLYVKLRGQALKDKKEKYGFDNPLIDYYLGRDGEIKPYDNEFLLSNANYGFDYPKVYSPSRTEAYFSCPFSYYLGNVLSFPSEPSKPGVRFGNICHETLQRMYEDPTGDFDYTFFQCVEKDETENGALLPRDIALLSTIKEDLRHMYDFYRERESFIVNIETIVEKNLSLKVDDISLYGKADKIIVYGREHEFIALVDYKTYAKSFHPDDIQYGLDIQLPFYSLLINHDSSFTTSTISGIYLSPLTFNKEQRERVGLPKYGTNIRLDGVMVNDPQSMAEFDPGTEETKPGKYVKILTKKADENGNIEGLLSAIDLQRFEDETLQKVKEADARIHKNDFRINPVKRFEKGNEKDGCTYCSYRHVCFVKNKQWHFIGSSSQNDADLEEEEDYGE